MSNSQEKANQGSTLFSDSKTSQELTAVQALQEQKAIEISKKNGSVSGTKKSSQINGDLGLTGRKEAQSSAKGTNTQSQNIEKKSDRNLVTADKKADALETNKVKSDATSKAADSQKSSNGDYQIDTQSLNSLAANKAESDKTGKTDQADELAKELSVNLTTDKSGKTSNLTLKGNGTEDKLASGTEQTLNVNKTAGLDAKKRALLLKSEKIPDASTAEVSDWNGLANAMENTSINTINLTGDITVTGKIDGKGTNPPVVSQPNPAVNSGKLNLGGWAFFKYSAKNIARNLTINGNGHALNFGKYYISFTTNNQKNGTPWNLVIKNVTINADGRDSGTYAGAFSPFYMGGDDIDTKLLAKNKVTFDNVKADIKNGAFYTTTMAQQVSDNPYTTVTFEGDNTITCEGVNAKGSDDYNYSSAVSASHIIFANGTTNFYVSTKKSNNDTNAGGDILRAKVEDSKDTEAPIIIDEGATVNLNVPTKDISANDIHATDVRGILTNSALDGTVVVNGTLNADMQKGHSSAIWAGSLEIGKNGTVNINTQQDNQADGTENAWINGVTNYNGLHYAPISLGVGFAQNLTSADSHLTDNGTLKIVRNNTGKTLVPLIAFGSGGANPSKYNITVGDGATLDLEDNSTTFDSVLSGTKQKNTPPAGMITMFGTSSKDSFTLDNPGYVNFERNNKNSSLRGNFTRFEGTTNATWLNESNPSNNVTPIAQWDAGNFDGPSFVWYIKQLHTQNQWGNYANSYTSKKNPTANKGVDTILDATDNTFTMGANQAGKGSTSVTNGEVNTTGDTGVGYKTDYVNQFGNHFSWWLPQRLAMGSKLEQHGIVVNDADKYQPEVQPIDTDTSHKLNDLSIKGNITKNIGGITDLIGPDGKISYDGKIDWTKTHWYNSSEDSTNWTEIMGSGQKDPKPVAASVNTDGTLKEGTTSNTATIVYTDGSIDFVNIPIKVTAPSDSDTYNSHYQGTKAEKDKETDVAKPTIKNSSTGSTATDDLTKHTSYSAVTTGSDQTPTWVTVKSDGSLQLNPGDNVTVGMKNIPIQVKYGDGSSEVTDAPVYISDGTHSVIWGHDANGNTIGAVVLVTDPSKLNAHETSDNSQVLTPANAVTDIEEYTVADNGKATLAGHLDKSKVKISWEEAKTPDTVVTTPSKTGSTSGTLHVDLNGQANTYLGNDSGSIFENNMAIPMVGAVAKNPSTPVNVGFNTKLTKDEFDDLVDNNIPADEIAGYAWHNADGTDTLPEKATTATIRITFKDKDKNGNPTYLDIKLPANSIKVTSDADNYTVAYSDMKVARPNDDSTNSESEEPTVTPSTVPAGTISNYTIDSSFTSPTGVTISIDKNGKITATANKNAILGSFKVPVNVTYADTSTAKVNVTVSVTGFDKDPHGGDTHYYGDQTMLTFGLPVITVHKTTGTNIYDASQIKFDTICYYYNWSGQGYDASAYKNHKIYKLSDDRTKYVNEDDHADTFNASDLHTSWRTVGGYTYQADTDESKFSDGTATIHYQNANGSINSTGAEEEQTATNGTLPENLAGNSKYRFNFSFEGSDVPSGIEAPNGIWSNVYFNFLGATGKTDIPVNVGDAVPTDADAIEKYLDSNDVGTPSDSSVNNKWQVTNISWENGSEPGSNGKFDASNKSGIVRFDFKDPNNKTSYLDVKVKFVTGKYINPADHNKADDPLYSQTHADATRTITYDVSGTGHAAIADETQTVNYIRDGYEHLGSDGKADGTYIWNAWKPASTADENYPSKQVQQIDGYNSQINGQPGEYAPEASVVLDKDGKPENGDIVRVTYSAKLSEDINFTQDITYVDVEGNSVGTAKDAITGSFKRADGSSYTVTAATEKNAINDHIPAGWVIADHYIYPSDETIKLATPNAIKVTVKHGSKLINPGDKIPQGSDPTKGEPNEDVDPTDSQHTLKRIITVTDPSGNKDTVEQDIDFQRTGHIDTVNGNVTWDSWKPVDSTKDSFAEYDAPAIDGYTSGKAAAENKVSYTDGKQDEKVAIGYTANPQSVAIKFVDDDNNGSQVGETITKTGVTGGSLNETDLNDVKVPTHYDLASGQQLPTSYTFTAKRDQKITIHLVHKIDKDLDQNHIPSGALNPDGKTSTQKSDFSEDVKRTITAEEPSGNADLSQTVTLTRTGDYDEVTKKMSWNPWTTSTFAQVDAPSVAGYTPSPTSIAADTAKDGYVDPNIKITYSANKQNIKYQFVDDNRGGEAVGNPIEVDGKTDETVDPSQTVKIPAGYQLATGESIPISYKFGPTSPKDSVEIHLVHGSKKINPGDKIPAGTDPSKGQPKIDVNPTDSQHTLKRIITVTKPDGSTYTETQSIKFQRTGHIDTVTGNVTWDNWTPADPAKDSFDTYTAPAIEGYTSGEVDVITGVTYKDGDQDLTAAVGYTANDQSMTYKYWDDTENKEIGNDHVLSGKTDQTIDTNLTAPAGYDLVSGNTIPAQYTFKASGNNAITIHFTHHIDKNITKTPTDGAKDPTGKEVKDTDFSETVKRTITAKEPQEDGTIKDVDLSQSVTLTRTGNFDEVTKVITWNPWSTGSFDAVNAPTVAGYTPSQTVVPAVATVTNGYKDPKITITYTAGNHKMTYTFVDDDENGATVNSPITISGDTNQTVNTGLTIPDGFKLATGTDSATDIYDLPANYKFGSTDAAVKIHLVHKIDKGISKDQNPSDSKTSADDFSETVKRTITAHIPTTNGVAAHDQDLSETVTLTRTGDYDEALKKITHWNDWTTGTFDAVTAPKVDGYTASPSSIAEDTAKDGYVDPKIEINYSANDSNFKIIYKDGKGNTVSTKKVTGVTDGSVPSDSISSNIPAGWVTDGSVPTLPDKFVPQDKEKDITVKIKHGTKVVNPGDVPTPENRIPGDNGNKTPGDGKPKNDITYDNLHKDITRTITVQIPSGTRTVIQKMSYERQGIIDDVTGTVTYGNWIISSSSEQNLPEYDAPSVSGYTPSQSKVDAETPTSAEVVNWKDPEIVITYMIGDQHIIYQFVDDDSKDAAGNPTKVGSPITVSGKTNQTVNPSQVVKVPANYWLAKNQTIPTSVKLSTHNTDLGKTVLIHLVHAIKVIEPNDPSVDPNNTKMFSTVTRKIEVTAPGQTTPTHYLQSVKLERSEKVDAITNKVVGYGDWKVANSETSIEELSLDSEPSPEFPEWAVPQYDGYTSYVESAPSKEVKAALIKFDDQGYPENGKQVNVTYQKITNGGGSQGGGNDQPTPQGQIIIKYVDPNGKTVNTVTVPVAKGSTTDPSGAIKSNVPKGYKLPDGYTAPTSASEGSTISVSIVPINHKNPKPTSGGNKHKPTHNNKPSRKGKSRQTNAPKHNAKSSSNSAPLSERGPRGRGLSGHNLAALEAEKGIGQNGVKTVKISSQNGSHNANTLPQTGENDHRAKIMSTIGFLGLTAAGIIALLTLGGDRKRE